MPATSPRRPSGDTRSGLDVAAVLLAAGLLTALAAGALTVGPLVSDAGPGSPAGIAVLAAAAGVVLLAAVGVGGVVRGRRHRAAWGREIHDWFLGLPVATTATSRAAGRAEPAEHRSAERVLRRQIASLERALEGQDERLDDAVREERRKTLLTIAALRRALAHEPGDVALNRVEAALARLGVTPGFTRPALPEGRTGAPVVFLGAPQPLSPVASAPAATSGDATSGDGQPADLPAVPLEPQGPDAPPSPDEAVEAPVGTGPADGAPADGAPAEERPDEARPGTAADVTPSKPVVRPVPAPIRPPAPPNRRRRFRRASSGV